MATKVKGLLKGLRYISQIFDEEKEKEIKIGFPTDVKHVAHIGWDGPSTDNPSWMKEFNGPGQFQSAPLLPPAANNPEIQWASQDSNRRSRNADSSSAGDQQPEQPKSRRHSSSKDNGATDSPKKSRGSRRHHRKDSDGSKHGRIHLDSSAGTESPARDLPDIPKKSRQKKSKESVPGGAVAGSRSAKSKGTSSSTAAATGGGSESAIIQSSSIIS
ncbi:CRIB domain-containing protein RIC6 [Capsicum baccatum]|uniref:CRIB domain-containing protein RIC6 n=1 Tax=Capsicum baccatum TaxID=33114 RepID=A0A2G2WMU0_CAPBA|nr:CRIB domain-containing protein RIC5-like [Capsicum annuum]PHT46556.1 CRIB domain-containing protein RIC6 [Capsicum baccatum]PHU16292.1 CRIB domain-containing protein RIC6 [Capsicum chinense]